MTTVVAAGLPESVIADRDYDRAFGELADAGISGLFPQFSHIADLLAPYSSDDAAFRALRRHGIKLLVPGHMVYPLEALPSLEQDPMRQIIECAGRDAVLGITNYDEPAFSHELGQVEWLYDRVKQVDDTLPVWMVHAPIPRWFPGYEIRDASVRRNRTHDPDSPIPREVAGSIEFADLVGFDVYPVPEVIPTRSRRRTAEDSPRAATARRSGITSDGCGRSRASRSSWSCRASPWPPTTR